MSGETIPRGRARPKNKLYKIRKDIPAPRKDIYGYGKWQQRVVDMEVGDSILVDNWSEARSIRRAILKLHNKPSTVRKEGDEYRVWMMEQST
jgi:hypothetical protein